MVRWWWCLFTQPNLVYVNYNRASGAELVDVSISLHVSLSPFSRHHQHDRRNKPLSYRVSCSPVSISRYPWWCHDAILIISLHCSTRSWISRGTMSSYPNQDSKKIFRKRTGMLRCLYRKQDSVHSTPYLSDVLHALFRTRGWIITCKNCHCFLLAGQPIIAFSIMLTEEEGYFRLRAGLGSLVCSYFVYPNWRVSH